MDTIKSRPEALGCRIFVQIFLCFIFLGLTFFISAGTIYYWQAWVYLILLTISTVSVSIYFLKRDPEFLKSRMKGKEKVSLQKKIVGIFYPVFLFFFLFPGLDKRYGWSHVPATVVILSDLLVLISYYWVFLVFKENRYASRIIEVVKSQKVITTGPYSIVRHPMYLASIVMWGLSPVALGSALGAFFIVFLIGFLVVRILDEEKLLLRDLGGYSEYTKKTKYRLFPGVW